MTAPQIQTFIVHKQVLIAKSVFFARALRNRDVSCPGSAKSTTAAWIEGETGVVRLPEDDPEIFARYLPLLHSGKAPIFRGPGSSDSEDGQIVEEDKMLKDYGTFMDICSRLYIFCEKIQDISSKQALFLSIVQASTVRDAKGKRSYYPVKCTLVNTLYDGTTASDPVRSFLVDVVVWRGHDRWIKYLLGYIIEFLQNVVAQMYKDGSCRKTSLDMFADYTQYCEDLFATEET